MPAAAFCAYHVSQSASTLQYVGVYYRDEYLNDSPRCRSMPTGVEPDSQCAELYEVTRRACNLLEKSPQLDLFSAFIRVNHQFLFFTFLSFRLCSSAQLTWSVEPNLGQCHHVYLDSETHVLKRVGIHVLLYLVLVFLADAFQRFLPEVSATGVCRHGVGCVLFSPVYC